MSHTLTSIVCDMGMSHTYVRFLAACVEMTAAFGTVLGELFTTAMRNEPTSTITEDAAALMDGVVEGR